MNYFKIKPFDLGPIYGPIDHYNLPILGLPHNYDDFHSSVVAIPDQDAIPMIILEPGFGNLIELKLIEGDFESLGHNYNPPLPTLWCVEDCITVSKLVYGQDKMQLPYTHVSFKDDDFTLLSSKDSAMRWLDDTLFGKTQFCVYYWIRVMALYPEYLLIGDKEKVSPENYERAFSLVENLKNLKARGAFTKPDQFRIRVANFDTELTDIAKDNVGNDVCSLKLYGTGLAFEVWQTYAQEHTMNRELTIEYSNLFGNLLYGLLPVFDRYNILLTMFHGMHQIKHAGLKPSEKFFEAIIKC